MPIKQLVELNIADSVGKLIYIFFLVQSLYKVSNGEENKLSLWVARLFIFMTAIVTINYFHSNCSYIQIVCMFVIINSELIISKMASSNPRLGAIYYVMMCVFCKSFAIIIVLYVIYVQFNQIIEYLDIPF